jgi:hypothetical protein
LAIKAMPQESIALMKKQSTSAPRARKDARDESSNGRYKVLAAGRQEA